MPASILGASKEGQRSQSRPNKARNLKGRDFALTSPWAFLRRQVSKTSCFAWCIASILIGPSNLLTGMDMWHVPDIFQNGWNCAGSLWLAETSSWFSTRRMKIFGCLQTNQGKQWKSRRWLSSMGSGQVSSPWVMKLGLLIISYYIVSFVL